MKRIIALLIALASVLSISACSFKELTPEEKAASRAAKESEYAAEVSSKEAAIVEDKGEVLDELGKSQKGKKLVMRNYNQSDGTERLREIYFDKNGFADYMITYCYYPESNYYVIRDQGDKGSNKLIDHDDDLRLIVYKKSYKDAYDIDITYDELVESFKTTTAWEIIE